MLLVLKLLAALTILMIVLANYRIKKAHRDTPPIGQILNVNGHKVHAVVMGSGPDLVLIHGSNGNIRDFTMSIAPELATRYRVIMFDRHGHGYTPEINPEGDPIKDQALLLKEAALQLGADKPIVVGHSFGGAVALAWAIHAPNNISGLMPLSAVSNTWDTGLSPMYWSAALPIFGHAVCYFIAAFGYENKIRRGLKEVFEPDQVPHGYFHNFGVDLLLRPRAIRANALQRKVLVHQILEQVEDYAHIQVPTEIVHGNQDSTVPMSVHADKLVTQIPNAQMTTLDGLGHMPHHSGKALVIDAIDRLHARVQTSQPT